MRLFVSVPCCTPLSSGEKRLLGYKGMMSGGSEVGSTEQLQEEWVIKIHPTERTKKE